LKLEVQKLREKLNLYEKQTMKEEAPKKKQKEVLKKVTTSNNTHNETDFHNAFIEALTDVYGFNPDMHKEMPNFDDYKDDELILEYLTDHGHPQTLNTPKKKEKRVKDNDEFPVQFRQNITLLFQTEKQPNIVSKKTINKCFTIDFS
jgi:hypothetical protein